MLGTANFSIELNKLRSPDPVPGQEWTIPRSPGDLLVLFDFASSGNSIQLRLSQWLTRGSDPHSQCEANSSFPCWGRAVALNSNAAEGSVSTVEFMDPISNKVRQPGTFGKCCGRSRAWATSWSTSSSRAAAPTRPA